MDSISTVVHNINMFDTYQITNFNIILVDFVDARTFALIRNAGKTIFPGRSRGRNKNCFSSKGPPGI